jgi:hypothetical protein
MRGAPPGHALEIALVLVGVLAVQFMAVVVLGAWIQSARTRLNRMRIECHRRWEEALIAFLYQEGPLEPFRPRGADQRRMLVAFLHRALRTLGGTEGDRIRSIYVRLGLGRRIRERLHSSRAPLRALAAVEVGTFNLEAHFGQLPALLSDPVPHVAHAAARSLAQTGRLEFAEPVLRWVLGAEMFQLDRLLWILEGFGLEILPWMEARLAAEEAPPPQECTIYALLAASLRNVRDPARLLSILAMGGPEARIAAIKALGSVGDPSAYPAVLPYARHEDWVFRAQAAKALGILGGAASIPELLDLLRDPTFEVRRNAAEALARMGPAGREALAWVAQDRSADPFARDLALERLQWTPGGSAA